MDSTTDIPARPGPVRTCVGCRKRAAKTELVRVVAGPGTHGATVVPDPAGTAPGRGAHVHPAADCFEQAQRRRAFGRALRLAAGADASAVGAWIDSLQDQP